MVANMSKHTAYMGSTAGYVADQIRLKPDILQNAKVCVNSGSVPVGLPCNF